MQLRPLVLIVTLLWASGVGAAPITDADLAPIKLGKDEYRVEPEFPNEGYADPMPNGQNDTLWVALVEKAFAQASAESYANLERGNPARALDLRSAPTTPRLTAVHAAIREHVAPFTGDRSLSAELESLADAIADGALRRAAELPEELPDAPA